MEERPARSQPGGVRPPFVPPTALALGGSGESDDEAWFRLQIALRDRTGSILGPFELLKEQQARHGSFLGSGEAQWDWPFDRWLIRALDFLGEMPPDEVRVLWELYRFSLLSLQNEIWWRRQPRSIFFSRQARREICKDGRRIEDLENAFSLWNERLRIVEDRLMTFPSVWHPSRWERGRIR